MWLASCHSTTSLEKSSARKEPAERGRSVVKSLATTLAAICQPRLIGESSPTVDLDYVE